MFPQKGKMHDLDLQRPNLCVHKKARVKSGLFYFNQFRKNKKPLESLIQGAFRYWITLRLLLDQDDQCVAREYKYNYFTNTKARI